METSASQRLSSRRSRTRVPIDKLLLNPQTCSEVSQKLIKRNVKLAKYYNRGTAELETIKPGQAVRVKMGQKWVKAKVEHQVDVRSYKLRTENGHEYKRNRRQIRTTFESMNTLTNKTEANAKHRENERVRGLNKQALGIQRAKGDSTERSTTKQNARSKRHKGHKTKRSGRHIRTETERRKQRITKSKPSEGTLKKVRQTLLEVELPKHHPN